MFPGTAPDTCLQDFLACKPCRGLGQRLGKNSRGAIPDRIGTKTNTWLVCIGSGDQKAGQVDSRSTLDICRTPDRGVGCQGAEDGRCQTQVQPTIFVGR